MRRHEVLELCKTIVGRRIRGLEEELNTIFDMLGKEDSGAPETGCPRPSLSIGPENNTEIGTVVLDNYDKKCPVTKKAQGKPLVLSDSLFVTVNPIYNGEDYIDEVAAIFSKSYKDKDFLEFFAGFNFSQVLSGYKYYSLDVAKQLYESMTGVDAQSFEVLSYLNKKEYFKGLIAYKRGNLYAFNSRGFGIIQENIKKYSENKKHTDAPTIPDFLTNILDLEKVSRENMTISGLAALYCELYGKQIDDRIIRNALIAKHITVISVFGDKRPARGETLAEMLRRYRKLRIGKNKEEKPGILPPKPSDGLYTSIGELMKDKLKTTLNKQS